MKTWLCAVGSAALAWSAWGAGHELELTERVASVEEGLVLGNGDMSASLAWIGDAFVVRFGKGDVWDRRVDMSLSPKPATQREFIDAVLKERWKCRWNGWGLEALNGAKDEKRMKELCCGTGPAAKNFPYPCPKSPGELRMRLPADLRGPAKFSERLFIEEGRVLASWKWPNGVVIAVECAIHPSENVFAMKWRVGGWNDDTCVGSAAASPVFFELVREGDPDPDQAEYDAAYSSTPFRYRYFSDRSLATPLPRPTSMMTESGCAVEQAFYPDRLFPDGFRCRMTLQADGSRIAMRTAIPQIAERLRDAWAFAEPRDGTMSGELSVRITTSSDGSLDAPQAPPHGEVLVAARTAGLRHWSESAISIPSDRELERFWYATYHARRCILRGGTVPPGLFFPSTLPALPNWHGDYHMNYNLQSTYWGDFTANRLSEAEAYFDAVDFARPLGRKIARDYYGCRGVYIHLQVYPVVADDDYNGCLTLGRMVYMTGWAMTRYIEYYRYTLDRDWLAARGYPFIKECALFYLDFLKKAPSPDLPPELNDGKYHAFPSVQYEDGLSGNAMDLADRPQVLSFIRFSLASAIEASEILGVDDDLRLQWKDRLENIVGYRSDLTGYARHCYLVCPPENVYAGHGVPFVEPKTPTPEELEKMGLPESRRDKGYAGATLRWRYGFARNPGFVYERDYVAYRKMLSRWMHPNGLLWAMSIAGQGRSGAWTESLSCMAPLQEMLLTSWDGAIRLFPLWRAKDDISFSGWRAQGAFIVSAALKGGSLVRFSVKSEKGADCLVHGDWKVKDANGVAVPTDRDDFGRLRFKTTVGGQYELTRLCE